MDATIAQLREEISRLQGPARVRMLERLWQELSVRYWRAGPGAPAALGHLSAAIEAMTEAYQLMDATDSSRRQVAGQLGWFLCVRYGSHGGEEADRETAITLLTEAVAYADLAPELSTVALVSLGQLHLDRVLKAMDPAFGHGMSPSLRADLEQAVRHLRVVDARPPVSAEVSAITRIMLGLAESLLPLLNGDLARFDASKFSQAVREMNELSQNGFPAGMPGSILSSSLPPLADLSRMNPLDFPVPDLRGDPGHTPSVPPRRPTIAPKTPVDPDSARRATRSRLASLAGEPGSPVWEQVRTLLATGRERMATGDLDAFVGAAANAVEMGEADDPVESGLDRLLSAIGLCLRERRDGSGWGDGTAAGGYRAAAELLLAAATRIPAEHPAAAVVVEALGGLLDPRRPLSGAITEIADPLGKYAAEVSPGNATVTALGELCRTVAALTAGAGPGPGGLADAIAAVPAEHAWHGVLTTAADQVRLAAAVRAGDAVAVDLDSDELASLLDAVLRDDAVALRAAVDALAGPGWRPPGFAAVLGAAYLELAIRAPAREQNDLTAAIELLSASAEELGDASGSLRTRTWWRLAEAFRRRGIDTDGESSRAAGLEALHGGDRDPRSAARFAGWMLADGRAAEAYTALEIAAAVGCSPESATGRPESGQLAEDVCNVMLGIGQRSARPAEVPAWPEVAAAVRKAGAFALLYLHPTDDASRTAGVLCLDPGTHRLEVLANVPVTDPLTSDDPSWSAILGRWSGGGLLVAATGELRRIAIPAVLTGDGRRLAQDVSVGYVSSGAEVIGLARRAVVPVGKAPLFVVNPRGDRDPDMADVLALRRLFYPWSACVGRALEAVDGSGTRQDVLTRLPESSLVHLACGLRGTELDLAGGEALDVTEVCGRGLVILTECGTRGFGPIAEAFLSAGFAGVIGWQWPVPGSFAGLALFMTHLMLVDHRRPPVLAVAAVQRWMLDPGRELPPLLPAAHRSTVETTDLTRPALWAALAYHGC